MKDKLPRFLRGKTGYALIIAVFGVPMMLAVHQVFIRFPETTCVVCHEMKTPVKRWRDSGAAKNHPGCVGCHFDTGIKGEIDMDRLSVLEFLKHFTRDPNEPIKPPAEPLFLDENKDPGYYSLVPNHRCFQCKDAKNHREMEQRMIHSKLVSDIISRPCKDCHNHEMRMGEKFYEKILPKEKGEGEDQAPTGGIQG